MLLWLSACAILKLSSIGGSFPPDAGELFAQGLEAPLLVRRDTLGVPHIEAGSERDAWFGLGYVHAQDRLFQLDLTRKTAFGELSPWFGERTVSYDTFVQALALRDVARQTVARSSPGARAMLEAYAQGVNAGAASLRRLPIEHRLLGVAFAPYLPEDALAVTLLQSLGLSENLDYEMAAWSLRDLPAGDIDALLRTDPHSPEIDGFFDEVSALSVGEWTPAFQGFVGVLGMAPDRRATASNSWVIAGESTVSGLPIVANDPHLRQRVPSLWYAAHVRGGALDAAGATLPGYPGVVIGHSQHVAWGLTNVMADQIDLAVVKRDGEDGYILAGERKELRLVTVEVAVKDAASVLGTVPFTELGPVVTESAEHLMVLQWAALQVDDAVPDLSRDLALAPSVDAVLDAVRAQPLSIANHLVVADTAGDFAWQVVGSVVGRQSHTGRFPYPAYDARHGWFGFLEAVPGEHAPERGFIVTANARPAHPLADAISTSFVPPHRQARIEALLSEVDKHVPADSEQIQRDVLEMGAAWHRDRLLEGVEPVTEGAKRCLSLLTAWDGHANADSVGASVWAVFHEAYVRRAIADEVPADVVAVVLSVASAGRSPLDNERFEKRFVQDRATTAGVALDDACARLTTLLGKETAWSWGALHPLVLRHPFTAQAPGLLGRWDLPVVPWPGSGATVGAAGYAWGVPRDERLPVGVMASLRIVMPLDDLSKSTLTYPGGQSGHPLHDDARSHFVHFASGQPLPLWTDAADLAAHTRTLLHLVPSQPVDAP